MRGRAAAEHLPHPRLRLLENRVARRRHQPGAGASGRAGELGSEDDAEIAEARSWGSSRLGDDTTATLEISPQAFD